VKVGCYDEHARQDELRYSFAKTATARLVKERSVRTSNTLR
jgi:hypothetical protein